MSFYTVDDAYPIKLIKTEKKSKQTNKKQTKKKKKKKKENHQELQIPICVTKTKE